MNAFGVQINLQLFPPPKKTQKIGRDLINFTVQSLITKL